jgi:hypothetical protein
LGCWISLCSGPFLLGARFETYEPFIYLILIFGGPWGTADTELVDEGARLFVYIYI